MDEVRDIKTGLDERLSDPKTVEALNSLLDRLTGLHSSGALDSFMQAIQAITFMKDGLTDTMINKNADMAMELMGIASEAASPDVKESLKEVKQMQKSGKLKALSEMADSLSFLLNSSTDKMLERNAAMAGELMNIASEAADPSMLEALRELKSLQQSGSLKNLAEASYMLSFLSNAATDSMVQRVAALTSTVMEEVTTMQILDVLKSSSRCLAMTTQQFAAFPPEPGFRNLLAVMKDPEVQMGMIFMATLAKNLHKCMVSTYKGA